MTLVATDAMQVSIDNNNATLTEGGNWAAAVYTSIQYSIQVYCLDSI
jgi:hypothetical protein